MADDRVKGRAQGIRAEMRELKRDGGGNRKGCHFLHFFDPH
jgi:hypothetical protein